MTAQRRSPSLTERLDVSYDGIRRAADLIKRGGVVAFGTETVYGLGALSTSRHAVARVFAVKGRPSFNPLINHFASKERAFEEAVLDGPLGTLAQQLADHFWPGPLTLVLPRHPKSRICDTASAALPSVALRVPRGRAVQQLLALIDAPVAAPSANRSGRISPSTAAHVVDGLNGLIDAVLNTGPCTVGVESTVLDLTGDKPVILRQGGVTQDALEEMCGPLSSPAPQPPSSSLRPTAPGQLSSHYAPSLPVRLDVTSPRPEEAYLCLGDTDQHVDSQQLIWNLSPSGDLAEAAARLFSGLHFLDHEGTRRGLKAIAVSPIPAHGMGLALRDRLQRAAAPRSVIEENASDG